MLEWLFTCIYLISFLLTSLGDADYSNPKWPQPISTFRIGEYLPYVSSSSSSSPSPPPEYAINQKNSYTYISKFASSMKFLELPRPPRLLLVDN